MKLIEKEKALAIVAAIVLVLSVLLSCLPVYATGAGVTATVLNAAPTVSSVDLTPDDVPATPGVQVINPDPTTTNKTVTVTAIVRDLNGYDDIVNTSVVANVTGPSVVEDSPLNLCFDSIVNLTTATYTGSFNMSNHSEGDYKVEVTATDFSGSTGAGAKNFTYLYAALPDTTPPAVTNPGTNPDSIVADGIHRSQLNITVTDASGIYSVTVDLTEIGGPAAEAMAKIEGTDIYTTNTTASVGTSPGTYYLPVNATDNSPNKNSDTSVSIPLTVLPAVTTYDFTTGAGKDKWAFRKQHKEKPPAKNDDPNNEFKVKEYKKIKFDDGTMQEDASAASGFYAIHRFNFNIAEPESSITKLDILWDGKATHDWVWSDGATLYIWNFSAGMYEQLVTGNDAYITLEGTITDNIGDYIDDDGSLIIIAEQNTAQWKLLGLKFRSRLGTDYVMVNVFVVVVE